MSTRIEITADFMGKVVRWPSYDYFPSKGETVKYFQKFYRVDDLVWDISPKGKLLRITMVMEEIF